MKKLLILTVLTLMTLTVFSQTTTLDTTKSTKIKLTPLTIEIESVKYKAFTFGQTRILMKELVTLDYLSTLNDIKNKEISEYKSIIDQKDSQIGSLYQLDKNNQIIIGNQTTVIRNKDAVIHIRDKTIKTQRRNLILGGAISIGVIGLLLFR